MQLVYGLSILLQASLTTANAQVVSDTPGLHSSTTTFQAMVPPQYQGLGSEFQAQWNFRGVIAFPPVSMVVDTSNGPLPGKYVQIQYVGTGQMATGSTSGCCGPGGSSLTPESWIETAFLRWPDSLHSQPFFVRGCPHSLPKREWYVQSLEAAMVQPHSDALELQNFVFQAMDSSIDGSLRIQRFCVGAGYISYRAYDESFGRSTGYGMPVYFDWGATGWFSWNAAAWVNELSMFAPVEPEGELEGEGPTGLQTNCPPDESLYMSGPASQSFGVEAETLQPSWFTESRLMPLLRDYESHDEYIEALNASGSALVVCNDIPFIAEQPGARPYNSACVYQSDGYMVVFGKPFSRRLVATKTPVKKVTDIHGTRCLVDGDRDAEIVYTPPMWFRYVQYRTTDPADPSSPWHNYYNSWGYGWGYGWSWYYGRYGSVYRLQFYKDGAWRNFPSANNWAYAVWQWGWTSYCATMGVGATGWAYVGIHMLECGQGGSTTVSDWEEATGIPFNSGGSMIGAGNTGSGSSIDVSDFAEAVRQGMTAASGATYQAVGNAVYDAMAQLANEGAFNSDGLKSDEFAEVFGQGYAPEGSEVGTEDKMGDSFGEIADAIGWGEGGTTGEVGAATDFLGGLAGTLGTSAPSDHCYVIPLSLVLGEGNDVTFCLVPQPGWSFYDEAETFRLGIRTLTAIAVIIWSFNCMFGLIRELT